MSNYDAPAYVPTHQKGDAPESVALYWFRSIDAEYLKARSKVAWRNTCLVWCVRSVSLVFDVPENVIVCKSKGERDTWLARQVVAYVLHTLMGYNLSEIARLLGRDRSTISYAVNVIEDMRDDYTFLAKLNRVYAALIIGIGEEHVTPQPVQRIAPVSFEHLKTNTTKVSQMRIADGKPSRIKVMGKGYSVPPSQRQVAQDKRHTNVNKRMVGRLSVLPQTGT